MPVVQVGQIVFLISDLASEVLIKVENRTSDTTRAYQWLVDTLLEVCSDSRLRDEFDQLEEYGTTFNLKSDGTQEYDDIASFIPSGDVNDATLDFLIWIDPPTNSKRKRLDYVSYQETDKFVFSKAQPIQWYRFSNVIGFYPVPDQAYQVQPRILKQHPINSDLGSTQILIPRDWNEILVLGAAMRGFIELEEYEKAGAIKALLYGDPVKPEDPGLLYRRKKRRERETLRKEMALRPVVRPYSHPSR